MQTKPIGTLSPRERTGYLLDHESPKAKKKRSFDFPLPISEDSLMIGISSSSLKNDWTQSPLSGLPLMSGIAHVSLGPWSSHTDVSEDESVEMFVLDDSLKIIFREPTEAYEDDAKLNWKRVVKAFKQAQGVSSPETIATSEPVAVEESVSEAESEQIGRVSELASACSELSGLDDGELAALVPDGVDRSTFNRWKNGKSCNPKRDNLYRLGLLEKFFRDVADTVDDRRNWLLAPSPEGEKSPYELLKSGRLTEAEHLLWTLPDTPQMAAQLLMPGSEPDESLPDSDDNYVPVLIEDEEHS